MIIKQKFVSKPNKKEIEVTFILNYEEIHLALKKYIEENSPEDMKIGLPPMKEDYYEVDWGDDKGEISYIQLSEKT